MNGCWQMRIVERQVLVKVRLERTEVSEVSDEAGMT
jgi:hypothetical protein